MKRNDNPKVYVGTYRKYNNGSITGAWIDLAKCGTYEAFLKKCKEVHDDERDPEFMIQDCENMPDGLTSVMEWLTEQEFNDIIEAYKEPEEPVEYSKDVSMDEYLGEIGKAWYGDMIDYFRKKVSGLYRLSNGGIFAFEKPSIETSFCFGYSDSAYDTEEYDNANNMAMHAQTSEEYFLKENLKSLDNAIHDIEDKSNDYYIYRDAYCSQKEPLNVWRYACLAGWRLEERKKHLADLTECNETDRKIISNALKHERAKFEKRLKTYLKRYGMSKVRSWSYWRDA